MAQDISDQQLMLAVQSGDMKAFETLVKKYKNYVFGVIARYVGDRDEAEDLSQEVFCRVYTARDSYQPTAKFTTWLYTITSHLCLNKIRDSKKHKHAQLGAKPGVETTQLGIDPSDTLSIDPAVIADKNEFSDVLQRALNELPEKQRLALLMFRFQNMPYQEIADTLGLSLSALKSLIFRGRAALAEKLGDYLDEKP